MVQRSPSRHTFLTALSILFCCLGLLTAAAPALASDYVLEDWDGPSGNWLSNPNLDFKGWETVSSDPQFLTGQTSSWNNLGRGLHLHGLPSLLRGSGSVEWQWRAPGTSTIYRADYAPASSTGPACLDEGMRTAAGTWQPSANAIPTWPLKASTHPTACSLIALLPRETFCSNAAACARTSSPIGNRAVFGLTRPALLISPLLHAYLPGARLYLTDYDKPSVTGGTNSLTGWVNAGTGTVTATATDTGLGVKSVTITGPSPLAGTAATKTTTLSCRGDRNDRCPASWNTAKPNTTASLTYDVATLPEGINPFTATATDIVDNTSAPNTTAIPPVKVDRSAPVNVSSTGDLTSNGSYWSGTGTQSVTVGASDPTAANGLALSGIKRLAIEEPGRGVVGSTTLSCQPDRCAADASAAVAVDMSTLSEGAHTLRASATDLAGNTAVGATWIVFVDRSAPSPPSNLDATLDTDTGITTLSWDTSTDPALVDGNQPSGVTGYRARYHIGAGSWSDWTTTDVPQLEISGASEGQQVATELFAFDAVGNLSGQSSASASVQQTTLTVNDPGDFLPGEEAQPADPSAIEAEPTGDLDPLGEISSSEPISDADAAILHRNEEIYTPLAARSLAAGATSSAFPTLCSGASPCGTYRGAGAAAYADNVWNKRNHKYDYFGGSGGDCTNFVSQALHYGGMHFLRTRGGINDPNADIHPLGQASYERGTDSWWSYYQIATETSGRIYYHTATSFVRSGVLYNQLVNNHLADNLSQLPASQAPRWKVGDVIFYRLTGQEIDHAQIVVKVTARSVVVAQHSRPYRQSLRTTLKDIAGTPGHIVDYSVVRPRATMMNVQ